MLVSVQDANSHFSHCSFSVFPSSTKSTKARKQHRPWMNLLVQGSALAIPLRHSDRFNKHAEFYI